MNTSEIWTTLGVEPTEDKEQIREAYLEALPSHHPEDDPKGFMKLRAAYEAALKAAKEANETDEAEGNALGASLNPISPEDPVQAKICEILADFPRRLDEAEWKKLFSDEGQTIDQQEALSEKLLIELMGGQYLPRRIWLLFDEIFSWRARAKHLKEKFPGGFIEYVLNGMRYDRAVRDEFFDFEKNAGEDFDAFVNAFHVLTETIRTGELDKAAELVKSNQGKLFEHPDYQLLVARLCRMREKPEEEREILEGLKKILPEDIFVRTAIGDFLLSNDPGEALEIYLGVLENTPEHYGARIGAARARLESGLYEEAKADSYELLMLDPYDGGAMGVFGAANEKLIPVFRERLDNDPSDMEARYKLSSCLFNTGDFEGSLALIADEEPDEKHRAKHYELYADLFVITTKDMSDEDRVILLEYIEAWEEAETDRQRLRFLPEKYHRLGLDDKALEKAEILQTEFPGDPVLCSVRAQIFRSRRDEFNAFAALAEGLENNPAHAALLSIEALLLEETGNIGAAVESANAALGNFPYNLEMWELLGRVFDYAENYDEVITSVRRAEGFGLSSNKLSILKAVALLETEDPDGEAQGLFEDALENDPDDAICLEKLSMIYAKSGRTTEAARLIERYIEKHEGPFAYLLRGWLYANFPQVTDKFAKARARSDFKKALELNEQYAPAWYQLGILAFDEGRMAEAAADFQLTIDIDPGFSNAHFYLALAYNQTCEVENALRVLDEGMAYAKDRDNESDHAMLLLKKADILLEHHRFREYAKLGEEPIKAEEERAGAAVRRAELAYALYVIREDEKAEEMYQRVFEGFGLSEAGKTPDIGRINSYYAEFLRFSKHDIAASIEFYKNANDSDGSMRSLIRLAKTLEAAGEGKEAKRLFKRALKLRAKYDNACRDYLTGECYFGLKHYKKAKELLGRAVSRATDHQDCPKRCCFEALFTLALIALEQGDKARARDLYGQVLETVEDRDYREFASLFGQIDTESGNA